MLKNYFTIAWRNVWKNKGFSLTNITGLSIGLACTMLILLWVHSERSWDNTQKNYNDVYHVMCNRDFNGEITTGPDMMYPLAKAAKEKFPEVKHAAMASFEDTRLFTVGDKRLNRSILTVSPEFFDVFSFETIEGNAAAAVKDPDALIVTQSTAMALFGSTNIIGKAVEVNNSRTAYVKAVLKDVPVNSTIKFEGLIPFNPSAPDIRESENDWVNCGNRVFFRTTANANIAGLEKKVLSLVKERTEGENPSTRGSIILHPMSKWRLNDEFKAGVYAGGRIEYVKLFTWIAVIILIIACVNFMNLSTARSEKRAKEVGIRKTLGSAKSQLLGQFIAESMLLSCIAFILACFFVYLALPAFSSLLKQEINIPFKDPSAWLLAGGIVIATGFIAGSYPAFYLSGFNPVKTLKGSFLPGKQGMIPRKILVTGQFIVSIVLISATIIIYQQLQHVKNRDLGYDQDNLVMVNSSRDTDKSFEAMKNDLLQSGQIESVTRTSAPVTNIFMSTSGIRWPGAPPSNNLVIGFMFTGADFAKTLQVKTIEGRDFKISDTNCVMFNQAAIKTMGLKNPVGTKINWAGRERLIVGITDNMVMTSPYKTADPLMMVYEDRWSGRINIRLKKEADLKKSIAGIETIYKKYSVEYPFEYRFVDEEFNEKFLNEQLIGKLSFIFAGLAIFICCLGLFGLVASSIERRKKEIGIRKVLGASAETLLLLMSKEFLLLVGLAFAIAIPAAWWAMHNWLQNFDYRISISIWFFAIVGLVVLLITFGTVSLNALKAAMNKPVKNLRSE